MSRTVDTIIDNSPYARCNAYEETYNENLTGRYDDSSYNSVFINGVYNKNIKEFKNKNDNTYYLASFKVPKSFSDNEFVTVTFQEYNKVRTKNKDYINLRFPEDYNIKAGILNSEGKREYMSVKAYDLASMHNEAIKNKAPVSNRRFLNSIIFNINEAGNGECKFEYDDHADKVDNDSVMSYIDSLKDSKDIDIMDAEIYARVGKDSCLDSFRKKIDSSYKGDNFVFEIGTLRDLYEDDVPFNTNLPVRDDYSEFIEVFNSHTIAIAQKLNDLYKENKCRSEGNSHYVIDEQCAESDISYLK